MAKKLISLLFTLVSFWGSSQNLFPVMISDCHLSSLCMDCGDLKVNVKQEDFTKLLERVSASSHASAVTGKIFFQVVVDSAGKACVISHTDKLNTPLTKDLIRELRDFKAWQPAMIGGKFQTTSIVVQFEMQSGKLEGSVQRKSTEELIKTVNRPLMPMLENDRYSYKIEHLKNYRLEVWNERNSILSANRLGDLAVDKNDQVWVTSRHSFYRMDSTGFTHSEQNIVDSVYYTTVAADTNNVIWIHTRFGVLSYDTKKWFLHYKTTALFDRVYKIVDNPASNETFFCTNKGLAIHKEGNWSMLNQATEKELPSDKILFAKRDSKKRLWIGTAKGVVAIREGGVVQGFEKGNSVLKGKTITSMDEDEAGNLYFGLLEYDWKDKETESHNGGIAIMRVDGKIEQYKPENSRMPVNRTNKVLYDKIEKILWISTDLGGLVRFDLKKNWEVYHNRNSLMPTSNLTDMVMDSKGTLYVSTSQGLVRITKVKSLK